MQMSNMEVLATVEELNARDNAQEPADRLFNVRVFAASATLMGVETFVSLQLRKVSKFQLFTRPEPLASKPGKTGLQS